MPLRQVELAFCRKLKLVWGWKYVSCYNPKIRIADLNKWEKAADGHLFHPAIIIGEEQKNDLETLQKYSGGHYKKEIIPCRNCIGCKLDSSREWANRGYLEAQNYDKDEVWFVTLTYDEDHIHMPEIIETKEGFTFTKEEWWKGNLELHDLQLFFKNLRKKCPGIKLKYMAAGEYGEEGQRPHYHAIIYGLKLDTNDLYNPRIINNEVYYQSKLIESCWVKREDDDTVTSRGISNVSQASWNTIAYTARYITKKINGNGSEELYAAMGQRKEFFVCSTRPGIGHDYYMQHKNEIYSTDSITIKNKKGITTCKPPKYFDDLYEKENPKRMKEIKAKRELESKNNELLKDMQSSLFRRERLEIEKRSKEDSSKMLRRQLEKKGIGY